MKLWKEKKIINTPKNNRINLVIAIVFLLGASCLYKLYDVQINKYDLYTALASNQHQIFNKLEPERGKIFISNYSSEKSGEDIIYPENNQTYPIATNKEYAQVYAIPKDIIEKQEIAEKLYIIFKKEMIEKEVDELLQKQAEEELENEINFVKTLDLPDKERLNKEAEVINRHENLKNSQEHIEFLKIKKEAEINLRKEIVVKDYLKILSKKGDPYEPLEKKVDEDTLKELYALLVSSGDKVVLASDLELKEGIIIKTKKKANNKEENEALTINGISHTMEIFRYYPEKNIGSHLLGFVSYAEDELRGDYGLEGFFDQELFGEYGSIRTERGANSDVIIINDREYIKPVNGSDLILTINRSIQFTACQKLEEAASRHEADGGSVIIMKPQSGEILAMCSWPDYNPNNYELVKDIKIFNNPAIFDQYEPGSVFKAITMAAALDQEIITPETVYNDEGKVNISGWPNPIKNSDYDSYGGHGEVNMNTVLELSLNTGAIFAMQQIGPKIFAQYIKNFGFGEKTGIELETESSGDIRNIEAEKIQDVYAATASFGQGITATALQMVTAYGAIANGGVLMKPYIVKEIINQDGTKNITQSKQFRKVISVRAATLLSGMLVNVVEGGHAKLASVEGYYVAGKTGTAQVASEGKRGYGSKTIHTFIGFAPVEEPKFVMLVKLDDPKDVSFSASSAAPLFGEIAEFLLNYYQVPKERK